MSKSDDDDKSASSSDDGNGKGVSGKQQSTSLSGDADDGQSAGHGSSDTAGHADSSNVDASDDLFTFGDVHGQAQASASSNWSDVIEMDINDDLSSGQGGTWTEEIDGQKIVDGHGSDKSDHDTGKGHSDHGDLDMDHIDKLQW
ncbi:hypothetical protein [Noviherbaspirillum sp. ST9]|uniref:hypothetical protein n=1 Tax=Noviherbaspirillum sp. ST9 TaxID=3401606 RepID=UPI003B5899A7